MEVGKGLPYRKNCFQNYIGNNFGQDGKTRVSQRESGRRGLSRLLKVKKGGQRTLAPNPGTLERIKWGVFGRGGSCNSRFVLKPDVAITSEVSISDTLVITDFFAKKMQLVKYCENPLPGPPPFAIPKLA